MQLISTSAGTSASSTYLPVEPTPAARVRRKEGRFSEKPGMRLVRMGFRALSIVCPTLAAQIGYTLLSTPPSTPERLWQRALRLAARTKHIAFADGNIAVYEWGAGPAVLMVHGWGGRATHLGKLIMPLVNAGFRVVAFDAPACGSSSGKRLDLVKYSAAVNAVARDAGPLHTLIAHSFGCPIALMAMRDWRVEAQRLVMISSIHELKWFTDAFCHYTGISQRVMERMKQIMVERNNGWFDWSKGSVTEMLRRTGLPALLIHDKQDPEVPFSHSLELLRAGPQVRLMSTDGFGHHRLLGNPLVIEKVVSFAQAQK
jgi:pimeloyl-ACP methyl ester carboxylesterase